MNRWKGITKYEKDLEHPVYLHGMEHDEEVKKMTVPEQYNAAAYMLNNSPVGVLYYDDDPIIQAITSFYRALYSDQRQTKVDVVSLD